jgi:large subunit ribosomal protein L17
MRHLNAGRKLNRSASHRRALFRNLVTALLERERIKTTDAKAKETRRLAERMITLGKEGTLAARRRALTFVQSRAVVKKLFDDIAPRFKERPGGYTRIIKVGIRHGDAAPVSVLELVTRKADLEAAAEGDKQKKRRGAPRGGKAAAAKGGKSEAGAAKSGKRAAAG